MMRIRERGKQPVHQRGEALRVILVRLGNCGKAAHVAQQDGHLALFPTEHELLWGLRQLLDERGSKVLAESVADLAALCLCGMVGVEGDDLLSCSPGRVLDMTDRERRSPISKCGPPAHQDECDGEQTNGCGGFG